jgi:hypothetical protein
MRAEHPQSAMEPMLRSKPRVNPGYGTPAARSRTRAGDTVCRCVGVQSMPNGTTCGSVEVQNTNRRHGMSFHQGLEHRETPTRVVDSRSGTSGNAQACRLVGVQSSPKPLGVSFRRAPDLDQATSHVVVSNSESRPSHKACGCSGIQSSPKPLCMPLCRAPERGRVTKRAVVSKSESRPSHKARGCIGSRLRVTTA